jgi:hypothetical protein
MAYIEWVGKMQEKSKKFGGILAACVACKKRASRIPKIDAGILAARVACPLCHTPTKQRVLVISRRTQP